MPPGATRRPQSPRKPPRHMCFGGRERDPNRTPATTCGVHRLSAREAADAGLAALIGCAFNYEPMPPSSPSTVACRFCM